jgi:BON domain
MRVSMKTGFGVAVLAGGLALGAAAQQKQSVPDAQVEANVLRALASAPELSTQNIQTTTVYGVVTLSGSTTDEASRTKAENLAARAVGVQKVVDEMTVGASPDAQNQPAAPNGGDPAQGGVLQSDGTYAPAAPPQDQGPQQAQAGQPQGAPEPGYVSPPAPPAGGQYPQANGQSPQANGQYPPPPNGQYPPANGQYPPRRSMYRNQDYPPVPGGQIAGKQVTVPTGAMVRIRITEGLNTKHTQPGSIFDGTVLNDVVADGAVAIPRGAAVQGTVVESKSSGAIKGRGELELQLTRLSMGGQNYTLTSDVWTRDGADKTNHTVNSAIGLGALGAVIGAVAGGGRGAAIGAGAGGAAGVASSAASPKGQVVIPPEAVLVFHLAQPAAVATVSEQEMQRLSYAAGPNTAPVVRRPYPPPYYAPYPAYYYPR